MAEAPLPLSSSPAEEQRYAVYKTTRTYYGELVGSRGVLPRHTEISLPPSLHDKAKAEGLEFVRWAGER